MGVLVAAMTLAACGEGTATVATDGSASGGRSAATGDEQIQWQIVTEEDAGPDIIETEYYLADIGLPDKKGMEIHLTGDDSSTLRWRFAQQPETFVMEWVKVDGVAAFETSGLIGDPTTAAKILEFHGNAAADTTDHLRAGRDRSRDANGGAGQAAGIQLPRAGARREGLLLPLRLSR